MDEKQRINKVLKGDTSAFGYFVDTYQDMAVTIAYRICKNKQDAEDIVQNSFIKAFHNLHSFRADSKFSTWFYRIVYNTASTETRSASYNVELVDYKLMDTDTFHPDFDIIAQIEEKERKLMINSVLNKMPGDESTLLTLYYLEENPIKEIAQITGLTDVNIKVKLHRARKRFYDILQKEKI